MTRHFCAACKSAAEPTHGTALSVHMSENIVLGTDRTVCKPEFGSTRWPLGPTTNSRHPGTPTDGERALSAPGAGDDAPVTRGRRRLETSASFCTSGPPSHGRTVAQQRTTAEVLGNPLSHVWAPGIAAGVAVTDPHTLLAKCGRPAAITNLEQEGEPVLGATEALSPEPAPLTPAPENGPCSVFSRTHGGQGQARAAPERPP